MNKIRIIDLLNKIANGEEVPKKIKYDGMIFDYQEDTYEYLCYEENNFSLLGYDNPYDMLNDNVEIIEEEKEIKEFEYKIIDKYMCFQNGMTKSDREHLDSDFEDILIKINELIDEINELKSGKDE